MSRISIVVLAMILLTPTIARAEQWQATMSLLADKSPGGCAIRAGGTSGDIAIRYAFDLAGDTFAGTAPTGKLFTTKVANDGSVNHEFKSPSGARLIVFGNVKTRKLEIKNINSFCVWELIPITN
jgi:hypothetical protein